MQNAEPIQMKNEKISELLNNCITAGDFPSAVYLVAEKGEIRFTDALGLAVKTPEIEIPAKLETVYDLASLTKVLATGLLLAKLIELDEIKLNDFVGSFFNGFNTTEKRRLTILDLLAHVSGFLAWKPFYFLLQKSNQLYDNALDPKPEVLSAIQMSDLQDAPRERVRYSDFNFLALGFLLEQIFNANLEEIASKEIVAPLKLAKTYFNPNIERAEIAACEFGNEYEKQTCLNMNFDVNGFAWRKHLIWGEVHDGNCYFLNGVSGHAGLFSTAAEVFKIALQFLPNSTALLKPETCKLFKTNFTRNLNEARSFAFELAETKDSTASNALAKNSFGHLGFTGTSLWIEPDTERIFILLTNRTHRPLPFVNINGTRRRFHELATEALNAV